MRVQCPHCLQTVTLDNSKAEQPSPCPACGHIFTPPALMNALPDELPIEPPPPSVVVPAAPVVTTAPPTPESPPAPTRANGPCCRMTISKRVVHWFGPVALCVLFVVSFLTWIAASPGGIPVYTQSAWGILYGWCDTDPAGDAVFHRQTEINAACHFTFAMFLALFLLIPSVVIGLADLFQQYINVPVPDIINKIWPKRLLALTIASGIIFLLLSLQMLAPMGLESAVAAQAEQKYALPADAAAENAKQRYERDLRKGMEYSMFGVRRTTALYLGWLASLIAVGGFGLEMALERRGKKQDPAIEVHW